MPAATQRSWNRMPFSLLPKYMMSSTCGLCSQAFSIGAGSPHTTPRVPGGAPTSSSAGTTTSCRTYITPSGALRGARTTRALPAKSEVTPRSALERGAFCGGLRQTTPSGCRRTEISRAPCRNSWSIWVR